MDRTPVRAPALFPMSPVEEILHGLDRTRAEMAERDGELRDVLIRLAQLYERIADGGSAPAHGGDELTVLLRSIETLATITEASITRASDLSRAVQLMVETVAGVAQRVDRLAVRADGVDGGLAAVRSTLDGVAEQVTMIGRHLGARGAARPHLRAVGRDTDSPPGH